MFLHGGACAWLARWMYSQWTRREADLGPEGVRPDGLISLIDASATRQPFRVVQCRSRRCCCCDVDDCYVGEMNVSVA